MSTCLERLHLPDCLHVTSNAQRGKVCSDDERDPCCGLGVLGPCGEKGECEDMAERGPVGKLSEGDLKRGLHGEAIRRP